MLNKSLGTAHLSSGWLNDPAAQNMLATLAVFQPAKFWLNAVAQRNMEFMLATLAVFQPARFWLKAVTDWNIASMPVTLAVFHFEMSPSGLY